MSKYFYILEGPDRSGKTTLGTRLAKHLAIRTSVIYYHLTWTHKLGKCMADYQGNVYTNLIWAHVELDLSIVLDRSWISNLIYGSVINKQEVCDWSEIQATLRRLGAVYILCDTPHIFSLHEDDKDTEHPYDEDTFRQIVNRYRQMREDLAITDNVIPYDRAKDGFDIPKFFSETLNIA